MKFEYAPGATPLDLDEINGLIPLHISNQKQLNEWEAANIVKAETWLFSKARLSNFLTIEFIKLLHKKMFCDTWIWAGNFRVTEKNIGTNPFSIASALKNLLDDVCWQVVNKSFSFDEIAYRFHHRLVSIHPFPNGNGRHSRLMTDLLLVKDGQTRFTWGKESLETESLVRKRYIQALRAADKHDYSALAEFVRS